MEKFVNRKDIYFLLKIIKNHQKGIILPKKEKMERVYTEISQKELGKYLEIPKTLLLDVRETWEFTDFNIGGLNIPPHEITEKITELGLYENIIVACSNGTRSSIVARLLTKKMPNTTIYHLEEGIF